MATKGKKPEAKKEATTTKVTRITATDTDAPAKKESKKAKKTVPAASETAQKAGRRNPAVAIRDYFAGAWYELKQVRWPNRRATWGMTMAVLAFTAFFVVLILLLDALFKYVFQLILG